MCWRDRQTDIRSRDEKDPRSISISLLFDAIVVPPTMSTVVEERKDSHDDGTFPAGVSCHDVLRELLWYLQKKRDSIKDTGEQLVLGDVVDCLKREGIWFWRDRRFAGSQETALRLAGKEPTTTPTDTNRHCLRSACCRPIKPTFPSLIRSGSVNP